MIPSPSPPSLQIGGNTHAAEGDLASVGGMQAELVFDAHDLVAGRVRRHEEGGNALLAGVGIGDGEDDDDVAVLARM